MNQVAISVVRRAGAGADDAEDTFAKPIVRVGAAACRQAYPSSLLTGKLLTAIAAFPLERQFSCEM